MSLIDFLNMKTNNKELCLIKQGGHFIHTAWISYDTYLIHPDIADKKVIDDYWATTRIVDSTHNTINIPCHCIEIEL